MLPGHNIPLLEADKVDFSITVDSSNLFCYPDRTLDITTDANGPFGMRFSELAVYIYYYELPEYKKEALKRLRAESGVAFAYRVFSNKEEQIFNGLYHETAYACPSSIITKSIMCFTNRGTAMVHPQPTYEIDFGGSVQGNKSCIARFQPNYLLVWDQIEGTRFPHASGGDDQKSMEVKKQMEETGGIDGNNEHTDKYRLV